MTPTAAKPISLLLVDDHEVVRLGLRSLLTHAGMQVVGEAGTADAAVKAALRLKPNVVLMDVRLPDGSGVAACRRIRDACRNTYVLFLSSYSDREAAMATAFGGAQGYLLKEIKAEALIGAIKAVADGRSVQDSALIQPIIRQMQGAGRVEQEKEPLSPQERRVLALVAEGKTNKEIATALGLSDKTVKNYLSNVYDKLQVNRRSQAAIEYVKRQGTASSTQ